MSDVASVNAIVVIPVADEARTIARVIKARARSRAGGGGGRRLPGRQRRGRAAAGAEVLRHPRRLGKAEALLTGVAAARRRGVASMVTLDGDGQHDADVDSRAAGRRRPRASAPSSWATGSTGRARCPPRASTRSAWPASSRAGLRAADARHAVGLSRLPAWRSSTRYARGAAASCSRPRSCWPRPPVAGPCRRSPWRRCRGGAERSRFRPLRDGVAIGVFLARRVGARWAREGRMVAADVLGVFDSQRMSSRHVAMLQAAVAYSDSPVRWSAAFVTAATRRAGARLGATWRAQPRARHRDGGPRARWRRPSRCRCCCSRRCWARGRPICSRRW